MLLTDWPVIYIDDVMARPKSDDRRKAILVAAIRVIAVQGLSAPTALIAKEAGVASGSLYTYFDTKTELLNALYVELKTEAAAFALAGLPVNRALREQMRHAWSHWLRWSVSEPEKRRVLAILGVSDDITPQSRKAADHAFSPLAKLLEQSCADGPMRKAPIALVATLVMGVAEATMGLMARDPVNADAHSKTAFDAVWRMIA